MKKPKYLETEMAKYRLVSQALIDSGVMPHQELLVVLYALKVHFQLVAYNQMNGFVNELEEPTT
jgi:hypothetical protein